MTSYQLLLKNEKENSYTIISWLMITLNLLAFLYIGIKDWDLGLLVPFIAAALLLFCFILTKRIAALKKREDLMIMFSFTLIIVSWIVLQYYIGAVANLALFMIQDITRRKLVVLVYEDRIIYPSFPKKDIAWSKLNNMMLRDGILTIDQKNNKLIQQEIDETTRAINEKDFNEFCRQQLNKKNISQVEHN